MNDVEWLFEIVSVRNMFYFKNLIVEQQSPKTLRSIYFKGRKTVDCEIYKVFKDNLSLSDKSLLQNVGSINTFYYLGTVRSDIMILREKFITDNSLTNRQKLFILDVVKFDYIYTENFTVLEKILLNECGNYKGTISIEHIMILKKIVREIFVEKIIFYLELKTKQKQMILF